ncbi:MAG: type VII toxin-antitoxin system HepT family RNase toxin [Burkholderiales bacterium]
MDRLIIERKLDSLQRCLARVRSKHPPDAATLAGDVDLQDVLVLNLSRAVQICVDLAAHLLPGLDLPPPDTMGQAFDRLAQAAVIAPDLALRLKKAVGFRNLAVHAYDSIDWGIVFAIATRHLGDFDDFAKAVARKAGL